jgi:hypothetical protein
MSRGQAGDPAAGGPDRVGGVRPLRRYYSGGPQVQPTCSRPPNPCAVVLADLGYLAA